MPALTIMLIRHAEKPDDPNLGPGLTELGAEDKHSLVVRGWQRAGTWAALFGTGALAADFPRPNAVYAANSASPAMVDAPVGRRPYETILPLSKRINVAPVTRFGVGNEAQMLDEVRLLSGVVLICWEHKRIVEAILPGLALGQTLPCLPAKWDRARYDVVLRFDRAEGAAQWSFRQLFPKLLDGDCDIPL